MPTLANNKWLDEFLGFFIHQLLAMVLCTIVSFLIAFVVEEGAFGISPHFYGLLLTSLFSPFYWAAAVVIGFWFNRRMRHHSACWVWVPPMLTAGLLFVRFSVSTLKDYERLLWCSGECLAAIFITLPCMNCIAYSVGAWVALRPRYRVEDEARQSSAGAE